MSLVSIDKNKCELSYACVRACPVNAIEIKVNQDYAKINSERCIGCGSCIPACPTEAISFLDSTEHVKKILSGDTDVIAIVAPSISGEFVDITDYRKFVQMIKELGFKNVLEVSFGADLIARHYQNLFTNFKGKYYLTSNCPVIVKYIEKYQPELITNLAPLISPMVATASVARKIYGDKTKVVYIGPCIEAKNEAEIYRDNPVRRIDEVLTFVELRKLFNEFSITEKTLEYSEFDGPLGNKGSLYPISNGLVQAADLNEDLLTGNILTVDGEKDMIEAALEFLESGELIQRHFNLFYCDGCLMGPGTTENGKKFLRQARVVEYANKRLNNHDFESWQQNMNKFSVLDFKREFKADDQRIMNPPKKKVDEVLQVINKDGAQQDRGCKACGYRSCKEFAIAVSQGLAKTEMCLKYNLKNRHDYIKALKVTNDQLARTQKALQESEKIAREEQEAAKEANEIITTMLHKLPSGLVILDNEMKILQANDTFIKFLGEEAEEINDIIPGLVGADIKTLLPYSAHNLFSYALSKNESVVNRDVQLADRLFNLSVFTIKKNKIVGGVIRDMYAPEVRKEEVLKRVTEVIDKNLSMVQQIGFLLGEGASETERMLKSIIKSYSDDKK